MVMNDAGDNSQANDEHGVAFPEIVEIEITDVFDLHTIKPREVRPVVEEYLRLAHERSFRSVRIIHGKGTGALRQIIRDSLTSNPMIASYESANANDGGEGATVVKLAV